MNGDMDTATILRKIEEAQSGYNSTLQGPYGTKRGTYTVIPLIKATHKNNYGLYCANGKCHPVQC